MSGLSGGERISTISLAILIQYCIVTDRQTDRQTKSFWQHNTALMLNIAWEKFYLIHKIPLFHHRFPFSAEFLQGFGPVLRHLCIIRRSVSWSVFQSLVPPFQRTTNRQWHIVVTWPMTSRDPERSNSVTYAYIGLEPNISRKSLITTLCSEKKHPLTFSSISL